MQSLNFVITVSLMCACSVKGQINEEYIGNLFLTGGDPTENRQDVEVISLDPQGQRPCSRPSEIPLGTANHVGTFSQGSVIICSGNLGRDCYRYDNVTDSWSLSGTLDRERSFAAGAMLDETSWWITGGREDGNDGTSTSVIYDTLTDEVAEFVTLPEVMAQHQVVKVNETTFFLIVQVDEDDSRAFLYDSLDFIELDRLPAPTKLGYAGMIEKEDGSKSVVVTGGYDKQNLTNIFDLESSAWREGPAFPGDSYDGASVQFGKTFLALGGIGHDGQTKSDIYSFDADEERWEVAQWVMQRGRYFFDAVLVPKDFVPCF